MLLLSTVQDTAFAIVILAVILLLTVAAVLFMRHEQKNYKKDKFLMIDDVVRFETLSRMVEFKLKNSKKDIYFSLVLLSIDNFDQISEYTGDRGGGEFMNNIIQNLHIIISKGSKIAIMEGKGELLIYMPELYDEDVLMEHAARFKETVEKKVKVMRNIPLQKSVSVSLVSYPSQGGSLDRLMHCVYAAMFDLKKSGGNGITVYAPEMDRGGVYVDHYLKLKQTVDDGKVKAFYSPIYDLARNRLAGCETQFMWGREDDTVIDYRDLLPYIEESGDDLWISTWSLEKTLMANVSLYRSENVKDYFITMPVGVKLLDNTETSRIFQESADKFGINPKSIVLEIENLDNVASSSRLMKNMLQLQAVGFKFLIDTVKFFDKALTLAEEYKIDYIKIDATTILNKKGLADNLIEYAKVNCKRIIASGVENKEQAELLKEKEIGFIEGAYLGINRTKEEMIALL